MRLVFLIPLTVLYGCDSSDPADGGFFNGVAGLSSGTYEARIDEREAQVAEAQRRNAELNAEIARLQGDLDSAKAALAKERARLRAQGRPLSAETDAKVTAALTATPSGATPQEQALALRQAIADARRLAESLASASG